MSWRAGTEPALLGLNGAEEEGGSDKRGPPVSGRGKTVRSVGAGDVVGLDQDR